MKIEISKIGIKFRRQNFEELFKGWNFKINKWMK